MMKGEGMHHAPDAEMQHTTNNEGGQEAFDEQEKQKFIVQAFAETEGMLNRLSGLTKTKAGKIAQFFVIGITLLIGTGAVAEARGRRHFAPLSENERFRADLDRGTQEIVERARYERELQRQHERIESWRRDLEREKFLADLEREKQEIVERARYERWLSERGLASAPIIVRPIPRPIAPYDQRTVPQGEAQRQLSEGEKHLLTERAMQQAQADFRGGIYQKTPVPPRGYETNGAALWHYELAYQRSYAELSAQQIGAAPPSSTGRVEPAPRLPVAPVVPETRRETQAELRTALKAMAEFAAAETAKGNRPYNEDPQAHLAPPDMARFSSIPHWKDAFERYYRDHVKALEKIKGSASSLQGQQDQDQGPTFTIKK